MNHSNTRSQVHRALLGGDIELASALAEQAVMQGHSDVVLYQLAARRREDQADWAGAHEMLARARTLAPGEPAILAEIAAVWRRSGNPEQALVILNAMIDRGLDHGPTWLERGHALNARNAHREAHESYARATRLDPGSAAALAGMTETAARLGDLATARQYGAQALALDPDNIVAVNALSAVEIENGEADAARTRLQGLLGRISHAEPGLVETLSQLGDADHALGRHEDAFASYALAQARYRRIAFPLFGDERRGQHALIRHVHDQVIHLNPSHWPALAPTHVPGAARHHIFLMGYPRSGTTLVENVLASARDVVALEEKPTMIASEPLLGAQNGVASLGELDQDTADQMRLAYWRAVAAEGADVSGRVFVDMNPIRGIHLPVIARLFPDARVVVMRRDPRDVVWSCYRRHFAITQTGYIFSDLDSTARHYDALMGLMHECLARLPLPFHVVRYEDLVADFDGVTRRLCDFTGIGWTAETREFGQTALRRGVTTASVRQVRRGLFNGTGQWRPYARHIAAILPIVQPWLDRYGYAD